MPSGVRTALRSALENRCALTTLIGRPRVGPTCSAPLEEEQCIAIKPRAIVPLRRKQDGLGRRSGLGAFRVAKRASCTIVALIESSCIAHASADCGSKAVHVAYRGLHRRVNNAAHATRRVAVVPDAKDEEEGPAMRATGRRETTASKRERITRTSYTRDRQ